MQIKEIKINVSLSKNYQKYECELTAILQDGDNFSECYKKLDLNVKKLAENGVNSLVENMPAPAPARTPAIKTPAKKITYNGLPIAKNIQFKSKQQGSDGKWYVFTADKDGRAMWFHKSDDDIIRIYIDEHLNDGNGDLSTAENAIVPSFLGLGDNVKLGDLDNYDLTLLLRDSETPPTLKPMIELLMAHMSTAD